MTWSRKTDVVCSLDMPKNDNYLLKTDLQDCDIYTQKKKIFPLKSVKGSIGSASTKILTQLTFLDWNLQNR